jgi:predicted PurR-regulated permease PerM
MSVERHALFWSCGLALFGLFLYLFSGILLPFVAGMALAYFLDPVADRLERTGMGRLGATLVILVLFLLILALVLIVLGPLLVRQFALLLDVLPGVFAKFQQILTEQGGPLLRRLGGEEAVSELRTSVGEIAKQSAGLAATLLQSLWTGGQALINTLALIFITPVVAFYILLDWDRMIARADSWLPLRHRETIRRLAHEIDGAIAGFLRGQAGVCFILGTFYAVALSLLGLNFGALIGMIAGLIGFIPYVGSLTGLFLAVGVALMQFWPEWHWIAAVIAVFVFGQFVEGNILAPKLVGASVGLHPVWLMFSLFAFGSLFGFVGLLLAVPLAAMVGVLLRFGMENYLASALYSGQPILSAPAKDLP